MTHATQTWEFWLDRVRSEVLRSQLGNGVTADEVKHLLSARLVYSAGPSGVFGATHHRAWKKGSGDVVPVLSVDALIQDDAAQLACTLVHEMGHILAAFREGGEPQGHGSEWKDACTDLGLPNAKAEVSGPDTWSDLAPTVSKAIQALELPLADGSSTRAYRWSKPGDVFEDGTPVPQGVLIGPDGSIRKFRCDAGVGVRGGVSSGTGAGSRYLLAVCAVCETQARVTRKHARGLLMCAGVPTVVPGKGADGLTVYTGMHEPVLMHYELNSRPATMTKVQAVKPAKPDKPSTAEVISKMRQSLRDQLDTSGINVPLSGAGPALDLATPAWPIDLPLPPWLSLVPLTQTPQGAAASWRVHASSAKDAQALGAHCPATANNLPRPLGKKARTAAKKGKGKAGKPARVHGKSLLAADFYQTKKRGRWCSVAARKGAEGFELWVHNPGKSLSMSRLTSPGRFPSLPELHAWLAQVVKDEPKVYRVRP